MYTSLFIIILTINSCKKDAVTKPVEFKSTTYQNLVPYNSLGEPDNLLKDAISDSMLAFINNFLPDGKNLPLAHPELFTSTATPDVIITHRSDVFLTFVSGYAGNANSVAFYTYSTNQPPASKLPSFNLSPATNGVR
jgi:glycopeptide antibiotics resistance protein